MKQISLLLLILLGFISCKKNADETCPNGYTGSNCDQQITPTNIILKSIKVTSFPPTDNGAGWDLTSGPDVYITISQNGNVLYTNSNAFIMNATAGVSFNTQYVLPSVTGIYTINVYDHDDFDADDFMGGIIAPIYTNTTGFPETLTLSCPGCAISFLIEIGYTF